MNEVLKSGRGTIGRPGLTKGKSRGSTDRGSNRGKNVNFGQAARGGKKKPRPNKGKNPAHYSKAAMAWYAGVRRGEAERAWYAGVQRAQLARQGKRAAGGGYVARSQRPRGFGTRRFGR